MMPRVGRRHYFSVNPIAVGRRLDHCREQDCSLCGPVITDTDGSKIIDYCRSCGGRIVIIGRPRVKGCRRYGDWIGRNYHKQCYIKGPIRSFKKLRTAYRKFFRRGSFTLDSWVSRKEAIQKWMSDRIEEDSRIASEIAERAMIGVPKFDADEMKVVS